MNKELTNKGEDDAAFDLSCDEFGILDTKIMGVFGAMQRGISKEEALAKYKLTEQEYDTNVERVLNS